MATSIAPPSKRRLSPVYLTVGAIGLLALGAIFLYLRTPASKPAPELPSGEARAYLSHLQLSDVHMKATENFMRQQVVEIEGQLTNNGPRAINRIDLYCVFSGIDGREIYRERIPIVGKEHGPPLQAGSNRQFRLPFDSIPDGWNQAMPNLVIARIVFSV